MTLRTDLTDGDTNARAAVTAILAANDVTKPTPQQRNLIEEFLLVNNDVPGGDVSSLSDDEKGSAFVDFFYQLIREHMRQSGRANGIANSQATINAAINANVGLTE